MQDPEHDPILEALENCRVRLEKLKLGEQLTEQAGPTFAELGQRVDAVLEERRTNSDRRGLPRRSAERRSA
jgi:hypothetical protein